MYRNEGITALCNTSIMPTPANADLTLDTCNALAIIRIGILRTPE